MIKVRHTQWRIARTQGFTAIALALIDTRLSRSEHRREARYRVTDEEFLDALYA
jgi:hypothetical protein